MEEVAEAWRSLGAGHGSGEEGDGVGKGGYGGKSDCGADGGRSSGDCAADWNLLQHVGASVWDAGNDAAVFDECCPSLRNYYPRQKCSLFLLMSVSR